MLSIFRCNFWRKITPTLASPPLLHIHASAFKRTRTHCLKQTSTMLTTTFSKVPLRSTSNTCLFAPHPTPHSLSTFQHHSSQLISSRDVSQPRQLMGPGFLFMMKHPIAGARTQDLHQLSALLMHTFARTLSRAPFRTRPFARTLSLTFMSQARTRGAALTSPTEA